MKYNDADYDYSDVDYNDSVFINIKIVSDDNFPLDNPLFFA